MQTAGYKNARGKVLHYYNNKYIGGCDLDFFKIPPQILGEGAKIRLKKLGEPGEVFYELALEMIRTIEERAQEKRPAVLILPVGPVGQYPIFVRLVMERRLSLRHCWFINMDEYLDEDDNWLPTDHPLSFRGFMESEVYGTIDPALLMPEEQRLFPDPRDTGKVLKQITQLGGVDLCIGGLGINGHLAFNEPQPDLTAAAFAALPARVLDISAETRAVNALAGYGGAMAAMPARCVTLGMAEILGARKIRVGCFREWHRGAVRQAAYGDVTSAFPATLLQQHSDAEILLTTEVSRQPFGD